MKVCKRLFADNGNLILSTVYPATWSLFAAKRYFVPREQGIVGASTYQGANPLRASTVLRAVSVELVPFDSIDLPKASSLNPAVNIT